MHDMDDIKLSQLKTWLQAAWKNMTIKVWTRRKRWKTDTVYTSLTSLTMELATTPSTYI